ncbi:MAG: 3'-5' exonuclease [Chitinophagales bacterium]|nr:3'-5' exonuclease [Chitinophagales bacterium]MDW8392886.1 3'-5' exonuclease [Chitinophagales bacterium]
MDFIAIDFETANETSISACEIGVAVVRNFRITESRGWLIRPPELRFDPYNTQLHGIAAEHVRLEPNFRELWNELQFYLQGEMLVAHNASFDLQVLRSLLRYYRIAFEPVHYICSLQLARKAWGQRTRSFSLDALSRFLGISLQHHRAQSDAEACARITQAVFQEFQLVRPEEIEERLHLIPGRLSVAQLTYPQYKYARPTGLGATAKPVRKSQHWKRR